MPSVLIIDGFRFYFFSNESREPAHVHVASGGSRAKFWLDPVSLANSKGFNPPTINRIYALVRANQTLLLEKWNEYFSI